VIRRGALLLLAGGLGAAGLAHGSIFVGADTTRARLRVDAKGNAEVTFVSAGSPDTVIVPPRGQLHHGGSLAGPDVSRRVGAPRLPLALTVRRTPDGRLWALQAWQVTPGGTVELHLARWKGAPTALTLATDGTRVTGTASFQGKPVTGFTFTLEGKRPRIYVYLDCFACGGKPGWTRMTPVAPKADGSFAVYLRPEWKGTRYRATVAGPNIGATLAPDAQVVIAGS
jgi:hypothetical protein